MTAAVSRRGDYFRNRPQSALSVLSIKTLIWSRPGAAWLYKENQHEEVNPIRVPCGRSARR
jgi:hypothetical protein